MDRSQQHPKVRETVMLWSTEMLLEPRTGVHTGAGGGRVPFIGIHENGPSSPYHKGGSRCFNSSSFCLQSSLESFHIELSALPNHLPVGLTLSPGPLDLLCILLQEGRPFRVERQPPIILQVSSRAWLLGGSSSWIPFSGNLL